MSTSRIVVPMAAGNDGGGSNGNAEVSGSSSNNPADSTIQADDIAVETAPVLPPPTPFSDLKIDPKHDSVWDDLAA